MYTGNIILIGFSVGLFDCIKNTKTIIAENLLDFSSLKNFLIGSFDSGVLNTKSTLVFDVQGKKDSEIKLFLKNIMPIANDSFKSGWNAFSKRIVVLISPDSKLNPLFNTLGINGFSEETDIQDYIAMRDIGSEIRNLVTKKRTLVSLGSFFLYIKFFSTFFLRIPFL